MKQVRQVTKSIAPQEQAIWTLGDLYAYLTTWAYDVYDQEIHPALGQSPREEFARGLALSGTRDHHKGLYDDDFRYLSLASTRKGTAKVEAGRGIKIHYLYYWSNAFQPREVEEMQVPVRYDPFDIGTAYAYVQGRWVQCRSEQYLQLRGHSERELQIVSHELRKRHQNHAREAAITAKRLADFLASAQAHEGILMQRLHDLEARDVFARLGGYHMHVSGQTQEETEATNPLSPMAQKPEPGAVQTANDEAFDEDDEDLEELEEYEEYR